MTVYGVGEVIYPRVGLPLCADCTHPSEIHRYVVASDTQMAPGGCDGLNGPCACRRYRAPDGTVQAPGTKAPPTREQTWERYPNDAMSILKAADAPTVRCGQRLCGAPIWWGTTSANNRRCPFDITPTGDRTGTSHWRTCRQRPERSKGGRRDG